MSRMVHIDEGREWQPEICVLLSYSGPLVFLWQENGRILSTLATPLLPKVMLFVPSASP